MRDFAADADSVLMRADIAMYHAKANGKNQFVLFTEEMQQGVLHRLDIESWLREALDSNQLRVYYQPVVTMSDRRIHAVEALVRWQHPNLGMLSPDDFLDVAEETGLVVPLGKFVLRDACRQIRAWRDRYDANMMVSVNLSAAQLRDESLVEDVRLAMAEAGIGRGVSDARGHRGRADRRHRRGHRRARVALRARGHHRHRRLRDGLLLALAPAAFPVDVIKVDKTFVAGMCGDTEHSTLVRSVLAIATQFSLQVVAEGVRSEEQHAQLGRLGCDYGQGYLYSRPLPASQIDTLLGEPALNVG